MSGSKLRVTINPAKVLSFITIFYTEIISPVWWSFPYLSMILYIMTAGVTFLQYPSAFIRFVRKDKAFIFFGLYIVVNAMFSYGTAINFSISLQTVLNSIQALLAFTTICVISEHDKSIKSMAKIFIFILIVIGIILFVKPVNYSEGLGQTVYLTIGPNVNPHGIGVTAVFGVWLMFAMLSEGKTSITKIVSSVGFILFLLFIMFLTNSRKSIVAAAMLLVLLLYPFFKYIYQNMKRFQRFLLYGALLILLVVVFCYVLSNDILLSNNFLYRITEGMTGSSNMVRLDLMRDALVVFAAHPLMGVGLNNYRFYSKYGLYSHCTYAELLSCCGIIGSFFFILFCIALFSAIRKADRCLRRTTEIRNLHLSLAIVCAFVGFTQIFFYESNLMYMLTIIYASSRVKIYQAADHTSNNESNGKEGKQSA